MVISAPSTTTMRRARRRMMQRVPCQRCRRAFHLAGIVVPTSASGVGTGVRRASAFRAARRLGRCICPRLLRTRRRRWWSSRSRALRTLSRRRRRSSHWSPRQRGCSCTCPRPRAATRASVGCRGAGSQPQPPGIIWECSAPPSRRPWRMLALLRVGASHRWKMAPPATRRWSRSTIAKTRSSRSTMTTATTSRTRRRRNRPACARRRGRGARSGALAAGWSSAG